MVDGVGSFKDIRKLRNDKKADIVGLIVDDASGCGLSTRVAADAGGCLFCRASLVRSDHHLDRARDRPHPRVRVTTAPLTATTCPFAYGHGHVNGKWRDIMSYRQSCDGCLRIPFWSNPRVLYQGEPTGTDAEDNARVILEQAERVSKFR